MTWDLQIGNSPPTLGTLRLALNRATRLPKMEHPGRRWFAGSFLVCTEFSVKPTGTSCSTGTQPRLR